MNFVVIGRDVDNRNPAIAFGPFDDKENADDFCHFVNARTTAVYVTLPLHTPKANDVGGE